MAMRECCDVFETPNKVEQYEVCLMRMVNGVADGTDPILLLRPHLSPRGVERLRLKIETGTTPPKKRTATGDAK